VKPPLYIAPDFEEKCPQNILILPVAQTGQEHYSSIVRSNIVFEIATALKEKGYSVTEPTVLSSITLAKPLAELEEEDVREICTQTKTNAVLKSELNNYEFAFDKCGFLEGLTIHFYLISREGHFLWENKLDFRDEISSNLILVPDNIPPPEKMIPEAFLSFPERK
jgi:hypothetical protein